MASIIPAASLLPIRAWRLYYADGRVVTSADCTWAGAPDQGVQVLELLHDPPYRTVEAGRDTYALPGEAAVKYGAWMDPAAFAALLTAVECGAR